MPPKQKPLSIVEKVVQGKLDSALAKSRASASATPAKRVSSAKGSQALIENTAQKQSSQKPMTRSAYKKPPQSAVPKKTKPKPTQQAEQLVDPMLDDEFNKTADPVGQKDLSDPMIEDADNKKKQ